MEKYTEMQREMLRESKGQSGQKVLMASSGYIWHDGGCQAPLPRDRGPAVYRFWSPTCAMYGGGSQHFEVLPRAPGWRAATLQDSWMGTW